MKYLLNEVKMTTILLFFLFIIVINVFPISINIVLLSFSILLILYLKPKIFKHEIMLYIISTILAILSFIYSSSDYFNYFNRGYVSIALFIIIMFAGVLPEKWIITRLMLKTRGTFSIIGFILISPHAFLHLFSIFEGINLFGIISYALMVPLTIISFKTIRREINPRDWKTIQKASYVIYFSLFLHLIWIGYWFDKIIYAVLITLYINNKLIKEYKK